MIFPETFSEKEKQSLLSRIPEIRGSLLGNLAQFRQYPEAKLLKAGDIYAGIWIEHNQDNFFLTDYAPESAWASQDVFMRFQRKDGLIPFSMRLNFDPALPESAAVSFGQLQTVWPFVTCAFEIAKKTGRPEKDLARIFEAGTRFDAWLAKYRDHDHIGLVEMFCEFDTGHDNAPRATDGGLPRVCPDRDAKNMPDLPEMPILCADLSAMRYGMRVTLAEIAGLLGKKEEASFWKLKAEETRLAIRKYLFDPGDEFYYDRGKNGFRKYRTEHVTRLFLNKVLTQEEFDLVYNRYFSTPGKDFLPAYPFPAVSIDDPHFVKECPRNSWGSNTQALTTLRALLWMDHYGKGSDLDALLGRWFRSFLDHPETTFPQELNPFTGNPVGDGVNYSPTLLIYLEGVKRLFQEKK